MFLQVFGKQPFQWKENCGHTLMVKNMVFASTNACDLGNGVFQAQILREQGDNEHEARCEFTLRFGHSGTVDMQFDLALPRDNLDMARLSREAKVNLTVQDGEAFFNQLHEHIAVLCADVLDRHAGLNPSPQPRV